MQVEFLTTDESLREFFNVYSKDKEVLCLDVETDGVNHKTAKLYGIGLCMEADKAFYIPIRDKTGKVLFSDSTLDKLSKALVKTATRSYLIGHNIIFDILILKNNLNIDLTQYIFADTILMKHCLDEEPPFGLKDIAVKYLGDWADKAQQALYENIKVNGGSITKENLEMYKADTKILGEYCGWDVLLTYKLFHKFYADLEEQNLVSLFFDEEVMPLYRECVITMKDKGFPVDVDYFKGLREELQENINRLGNNIQLTIAPLVADKVADILNEEFPIKPGGNFARAFAESFGLPTTKAKLDKLDLGNHVHHIREWLCRRADFPNEFIREARTIQQQMWHLKYPDEPYIFNISSNKQLAWLIFNKLNVTPLATTESGAPKLDADTLDKLAGQHEFCDMLVEHRKLQKILGTYVDGILERQHEGVIYGNFLMFGTTSGRFSSRDPNLQNLPRVKDDDANLSELVLKYTNAIKRGFIAPPGYKIVNADYSQLEPRAFASASGDELLQQSFRNKEDLYGSIAKNIWKLDCTANEVKKKYPELRQKAKVVALAVVYGAEAGRIAQVLKCEREEAQQIIDNYLSAYPGLNKYMEQCDRQAVTQGYVVSRFGRIRHLPRAKELYKNYGPKLMDFRWANARKLKEQRSEYKGYLNNAKNFPIQATAAHIVNRAMITVAKKFKEHSIDAYIVAQVHDEVTCIAKEEHATLAAQLLKEAMETTVQIEVPLIAEPVIGNNWAESK